MKVKFTEDHRYIPRTQRIADVANKSTDYK